MRVAVDTDAPLPTVPAAAPQSTARPTLEEAHAHCADMDGGAVTAGMTFLRWHPDTSAEARAEIRAALKPHGIAARTQPKGGDAPW